MDFAVLPNKEGFTEVSASGEHPRAHRQADHGAPRATYQGENRGGGTASASGAHPRARCGADSGIRYAKQPRTLIFGGRFGFGKGTAVPPNSKLARRDAEE